MTNGFHTFGMLYQPGQALTVYFDGKEMLSTKSGVPTGAYYIILNSGLANAGDSGWHTVTSASTPSPASMTIKEVQVYQ